MLVLFILWLGMWVIQINWHNLFLHIILELVSAQVLFTPLLIKSNLRVVATHRWFMFT